MSSRRMEAKIPVRKPVFTVHQNESQEPTLNTAVQAQLGRRLRVIFDGETAPTPDKFQELLAQIDKRLGDKSTS